jgi:hypothetical protein
MRFGLSVALSALLGVPFFTGLSGEASEKTGHACVCAADVEVSQGETVAVCACGCGGTPRPYCATKGCVCAKTGAVTRDAAKKAAKGCKCGCGGTPKPHCAFKGCQCSQRGAVDVAAVTQVTAACGCGCGGTPKPHCAHKGCVCARTQAVDVRAAQKLTAKCACGCGGTPRPSCSHKGCVCAQTQAVDSAWATQVMATCACGCGGTPQPRCAHKGCVCQKAAEMTAYLVNSGPVQQTMPGGPRTDTPEPPRHADHPPSSPPGTGTTAAPPGGTIPPAGDAPPSSGGPGTTEPPPPPATPGDARLACVTEGMKVNSRTTVEQHADNHPHTFCGRLDGGRMTITFFSVTGQGTRARLEGPIHAELSCSSPCGVTPGSCGPSPVSVGGDQLVPTQINQLVVSGDQANGLLSFGFPGEPLTVRFSGRVER